jgi:uncharacterized membrane protein
MNQLYMLKSKKKNRQIKLNLVNQQTRKWFFFFKENTQMVNNLIYHIFKLTLIFFFLTHSGYNRGWLHLELVEIVGRTVR